jgi:hypothetical protein
LLQQHKTKIAVEALKFISYYPVIQFPRVYPEERFRLIVPLLITIKTRLKGRRGKRENDGGGKSN